MTSLRPKNLRRNTQIQAIKANIAMMKTLPRVLLIPLTKARRESAGYDRQTINAAMTAERIASK
jgi:hypothetical protein